MTQHSGSGCLMDFNCLLVHPIAWVPTSRKFCILVAFRPVTTLAQIFKKPKDWPTIDHVQGIVYKVSCHDCALTYVRESKRLCSSQGAEHDLGCSSNRDPPTKQHAEPTNHDIHPWDAQILEQSVNNYQKRLFLESRHSVLDSTAIRVDILNKIYGLVD